MRAAAEKADPVPVVLFHRDHDNDLEHNNDDGDNHVDLELAHDADPDLKRTMTMVDPVGHDLWCVDLSCLFWIF